MADVQRAVISVTQNDNQQDYRIADDNVKLRTFWQAITVGDFPTAKVMLQYKKCDVNRYDIEGEQRLGCTGLHLAILEMPTWKGADQRQGVPGEEFVREFFKLLLEHDADVEKVCQYRGEWYLQTQAGKTKSFFPEGYDALGLVLQFIEITRGADVIASEVPHRLELIRDMILKHIEDRSHPKRARRSMSPYLNPRVFGSHLSSPTSHHPLTCSTAISKSGEHSASESRNYMNEWGLSLIATKIQDTPLARDGLCSPLLFTSAAEVLPVRRSFRFRDDYLAREHEARLLASDLGRALYESEPCAFSDVVVRCSGRELFLHRVILAARSPVFRAMFRWSVLPASETATPKIPESEGRFVVALDDIHDSEAVASFFHYLYTDELALSCNCHGAQYIFHPSSPKKGGMPLAFGSSISTEPFSFEVRDFESSSIRKRRKRGPSSNITTANVETGDESDEISEGCNRHLVVQELLILSNKYDVPSLKHLCQELLNGIICVDNAVSMLLLADANDSPRLRQEVLSFIAENAALVAKTPDFLQLDTAMIREIICAQPNSVASNHNVVHSASISQNTTPASFFTPPATHLQGPDTR